MSEIKKIHNEVRAVCVDFSDDIWGFLPLGVDGALLFTNTELSVNKREDIISCIPSSSNIVFLTGVNEKDTSLVQRVMMCGGALPGWKFSYGLGDWFDQADRRKVI